MKNLLIISVLWILSSQSYGQTCKGFWSYDKETSCRASANGVDHVRNVTGPNCPEIMESVSVTDGGKCGYSQSTSCAEMGEVNCRTITNSCVVRDDDGSCIQYERRCDTACVRYETVDVPKTCNILVGTGRRKACNEEKKFTKNDFHSSCAGSVKGVFQGPGKARLADEAPVTENGTEFSYRRASFANISNRKFACTSCEFAGNLSQKVACIDYNLKAIDSLKSPFNVYHNVQAIIELGLEIHDNHTSDLTDTEFEVIDRLIKTYIRP